MVQEKYFLEISSYNPDREPEEELIYKIEVYDFELKIDQIIFKDCINCKILAEMDHLNILKRSKKSQNLNLHLKSDLRVKNKSLCDDLAFYYEFNCTDSDLILLIMRMVSLIKSH